MRAKSLLLVEDLVAWYLFLPSPVVEQRTVVVAAIADIVAKVHN